MDDRLTDVSTNRQSDNDLVRQAPATEAAPGANASRFTVRLDGFEGPFDLLLGLIAKHKLDVTEVALSQVTDEFLSYIR
ncbi:MAG: segregation and condensation protein, partial [Frankiaceae bacterium]|nr:segregation and condensation protein [Frankiaceae bacterium]